MEDRNESQTDGIREPEGFWEDPRNVMRLLDLLFLFEETDEKNLPPS